MLIVMSIFVVVFHFMFRLFILSNALRQSSLNTPMVTPNYIIQRLKGTFSITILKSAWEFKRTVGMNILLFVILYISIGSALTLRKESIIILVVSILCVALYNSIWYVYRTWILSSITTTKVKEMQREVLMLRLTDEEEQSLNASLVSLVDVRCKITKIILTKVTLQNGTSLKELYSAPFLIPKNPQTYRSEGNPKIKVHFIGQYVISFKWE